MADSNSPEQLAREKLEEIGFAETLRRIASLEAQLARPSALERLATWLHTNACTNGPRRIQIFPTYLSKDTFDVLLYSGDRTAAWVPKERDLEAAIHAALDKVEGGR